MLAKLAVWIAVAIAVLLAIFLPVILVTGYFGGHPLASGLALVGLVLLALGVAWYVRAQRTVD
jgi:uncharacterized membrane protein YczE